MYKSLKNIQNCFTYLFDLWNFLNRNGKDQAYQTFFLDLIINVKTTSKRLGNDLGFSWTYCLWLHGPFSDKIRCFLRRLQPKTFDFLTLFEKSTKVATAGFTIFSVFFLGFITSKPRANAWVKILERFWTYQTTRYRTSYNHFETREIQIHV